MGHRARIEGFYAIEGNFPQHRISMQPCCQWRSFALTCAETRIKSPHYQLQKEAGIKIRRNNLIYQILLANNTLDATHSTRKFHPQHFILTFS